MKIVSDHGLSSDRTECSVRYAPSPSLREQSRFLIFLAFGSLDDTLKRKVIWMGGSRGLTTIYVPLSSLFEASFEDQRMSRCLGTTSVTHHGEQIFG